MEKISEIKIIKRSGKYFSGQIHHPSDVADFIRTVIGKDELALREHAVVLYLDRKNKITGYYRLSTGGVSSTIFDPKLIFSIALKSLSSGIIVAHNHPSGDVSPSMADFSVTGKMEEAAKLFEMDFLDHIIVSQNDFYSFTQKGDLEKPLDGIGVRTPITYYGGKQTLVKRLLALVPPHKLYCEPFFGGGALFFAKPKSEVEVINDINSEVVNFFQVVQKQFSELQKEIKASPHSRELFKKARVIYDFPDMFSPLKRAWAFWVLTNQGFAGMTTSWGFGKTNSKEKALENKRQDFSREYADRLKTVQIENNDAIKVVDRCDDKDTFFYVDPPYFNSDMGHYGGYTQENFIALLEKLSKIKGTFLLSSYPSDILKKYSKKNGWRTETIKKAVAVTKLTDKKKTEVLTFNYDPQEAIKKISAELKKLKIAA